MEFFRAIDWGAYNFFQFQTMRNAWLETALRGGDYLGSVWGIGTIVAITMVVLLLARRWSPSAVFLFTTALGFGLVLLSQNLSQRERPPDAVNLTSVAVNDSFPSRAVFMASLCLSMFASSCTPLLRMRRGRVLLHSLVTLLILYVCMSQLVLKLHFVSDVIGGLLGGLGLALIARGLLIKQRELL